MVSFCWLFILFAPLLPCQGQRDDAHNRVGVCLTTIPPRFATVYHAIHSWLQQESPPDVIVLFIPEKYQNFIGESRRDLTKNLKTITSELTLHFPQEIESGRILIQSMKIDWGPITKYVGLFEHHKELERKTGVDYWVIGDDDVRYSPNTLSDYLTAIKKNPNHQKKIFTHFKSHPRITAMVNHVLTPIQHLQGVDTILFPATLVSSTPTFSFSTVSVILKFLHSHCPKSYYQDDYVISFLVAHAQQRGGNIIVESIWSGNKVAHHVNGVSKAGQQMHTHKEVFDREEETKQCLVQFSDEISQIVLKLETEAEREL
jgi:hypothetical protein